MYLQPLHPRPSLNICGVLKRFLLNNFISFTPFYGQVTLSAWSHLIIWTFYLWPLQYCICWYEIQKYLSYFFPDYSWKYRISTTISCHKFCHEGTSVIEISTTKLNWNYLGFKQTVGSLFLYCKVIFLVQSKGCLFELPRPVTNQVQLEWKYQ